MAREASRMEYDLPSSCFTTTVIPWTQSSKSHYKLVLVDMEDIHLDEAFERTLDKDSAR